MTTQWQTDRAESEYTEWAKWANEQRQQNDLCLALVTAHEAIGAALALIRQQQYDDAERVLGEALKGRA